jgi:long-chain acyl-CoA synthetase
VDPPIPVFRLLEQAADEDGDKTALIFDGRPLTYLEMDDRANAVANFLRKAGFARGQRALVALTSRPEWVMVTQGVLKAGGAAVTPNPYWKRFELHNAWELTDPAAVFAEGEAAHLLHEVAAGTIEVSVDSLPPDSVSLGEVLTSPTTRSACPDIDVERMEAFIPFSSGTTGMPKAVRHSHRSIMAITLDWVEAAAMKRSDRLQFFLPMCTIYGIATLQAAIAARVPVTVLPRFELETMLRNVHEDQITIAFGAAPIALAMASHPELQRYDLSSLRYMVWGATPIAPDIAGRVTELSGVHWLHVYGSTEAGTIASNRAADGPASWRLDSPGRAVTDTQVRVIDMATGRPCPPGEVGELVVSSPQVMLGYLPDEANEEAFLEEGWFRTGDIGSVDVDGWVRVSDRAKELIKVSGFAVSPVEIESVLYQYPGVGDCAVFAVADSLTGERPFAAVVVRPGWTPTEAELCQFVVDRLAGYKRLAGVRFVDDIPRNPSGKVSRRLVAERAAAAEMTTSGARALPDRSVGRNRASDRA